VYGSQADLDASGHREPHGRGERRTNPYRVAEVAAHGLVEPGDHRRVEAVGCAGARHAISLAVALRAGIRTPPQVVRGPPRMSASGNGRTVVT